MRPLVVAAAVALFVPVAHADFPSQSYTAEQLWQPISPPFGTGAKNQPVPIQGLLLAAGNAAHELFDLADPYRPRLVSRFDSLHNDGEAESHQVAVWRGWEGTTRLVTISGLGVDLWDMSTPTAPVLLSTLDLEGVRYGDNTEAVWGVAWHGSTVYAGGTSTGLHVIDASDPREPTVVTRLSTDALGGVIAGPLWVTGDLMVVTTPKEFAGLATLSVADPRDPVLLDAVVESEKSYIGGFFGAHAHLITPLRVYDVTTDPTDIRLVSSTPTDAAEYVSYADGHLFLGAMRPNPGAMKWDLSTPDAPRMVGKVEGRRDGIDNGVFTDDQFSTPIGNLLVLCDDEVTRGCIVGVHDTRPDTRAPSVLWANPADGAVGVAPSAPIGLSFDDAIDERFLTPDTWQLRALDGDAPIPGDWGIQGTVVTFSPRAPLAEDTTYELVLPAGGVRDLVGNALTRDHVLTFATGDALLRLTCDPGPLPAVTVGETTTLTAADAGAPDATYAWAVGDTETTGPSVTTTWSAPGRYPVRLTVRAGTATRRCARTQIVAPAPAAEPPAVSSALAHDPARGLVWAVVTDADSLVAIDTATRARRHLVRVGQGPRTVALAPDGAVWVPSPDSDEIVVVDGDTGALRTTIATPYGARPYAVAIAGDTAWVACEGSGQLLGIDRAAVRIDHVIDLFDDPSAPRPSVRALALSPDRATAWVPQWISPDEHGLVHVVDLDAARVRDAILLAPSPGPDTQFDGAGVPNLLEHLTVSPDGAIAWIAGKKDNIGRGLLGTGEPLDADNTVRTLIAALDLTTGSEPTPRLDLDDHEGTHAVASSPRGDLLFIASRGSNRIDVHDAALGTKVGGFAAGLAPAGILVDDTGHAWVLDTLDRTLTVVDTRALLDATDAATPPVATVPLLDDEPLSPEILLGKQLFHNASASDLSQDGYISCASCHPDGGHDGRTWDFTDRGEGLRNTTDLRGRAGIAHGPVHWSGNFDEIQDFEHDIREHFGGAGLIDDALWTGEVTDPLGAPKAGLSSRLDALAAYVTSLDTFPRSPHRAPDGAWTDDARAGARLFVASGCDTCHAGDLLTDSPTGARHDVGTLTAASGQRLGGPLDGIDTPTLHGLHAAAPYLHDGSAATIAQVLENRDHVGRTFSARQSAQLTAFLMQLDGGPLPDARGCACASAGALPHPAWALALGLLVTLRRRQRPA